MSRLLKNYPNKVTSKYGQRSSGFHHGIDLVGSKNGSSVTDTILAHTEGLVIAVATGKKNDTGSTGLESYGNYVKIKHNNGYRTLYAHMKEVYVRVGETVKKGQKIGYMGNTGKSYGSHLHFEVRDTKDVRIDPTPYLEADLPEVKQEVKKVTVELPVIKKGVKCAEVGTMQTLINAKIGDKLEEKFGEMLDVDDSCGAKTERALGLYQEVSGLVVDYSCGKATWTSLLTT